MSDDQLREALCGFVFVSELQTILKDSVKMENSEVYKKYFEMLRNLKQICPANKKDVLDHVIRIVEGFKPQAEKGEEVKEAVKEKVK